ncbi:hypothetical protein D3C81_1459510 [compost metagenome]
MDMRKRAAHGTIVVFNEQHNTVVVDKVIDNDSDTVEMHGYILPLENARTFVDPVHGTPVYIFHLDIPAAIEAEHLKKLRRSQALKNMFQFERSSSFDIMKMVPYFIIVLLVLFK